ncbi:hypothetical protein [Streptomyces sp. NPDC001070]
MRTLVAETPGPPGLYSREPMRAEPLPVAFILVAVSEVSPGSRCAWSNGALSVVHWNDGWSAQGCQCGRCR